MSISGKYVSVGEEGFLDLLAKEGMPADKLAEMKQNRNEKHLYNIKLDGDKIIMKHTMGDKPDSRKMEYILGQTVEEKIGMGGKTVQSLATLSGSILTIVSSGVDVNRRSRVYKFSDAGLEVIHKSSYGEGKLIFKRQ
ncbi:unnamed protein product [Psylliodes chrysocephalus]|uniref:Uncharacterized protein n=1 Tax=Psylliodes chrysocephalus TaxID=3402493 RepID=A0A9P0GA12_9CUCU|nr:unnamed protein product [Psylliodes chrysocephala]